jgi:phage virion morphogenesis protein
MIEVQVDQAAFDNNLRELERRMGNLRPVMESIGAELESRIANRFETRRDPVGRFWAAWSKGYEAQYPSDGRGKVLERSGDMVSSLNWRADRSSVRVGFGVPYAAYHEFGTRRMPRRGLLFADPENGELSGADERAINELLTDWLNDAF